MNNAKFMLKEDDEYFEGMITKNYNQKESEPEKKGICKGMESFIGAVQAESGEIESCL